MTGGRVACGVAVIATGEGACVSAGADSAAAAGGELAGALEAGTDPGVATGAGATSLAEAEATSSGVLRLESTIAIAPIATTRTTAIETISVIRMAFWLLRFAGPGEPGRGGGGGPEITGMTIRRRCSSRPTWLTRNTNKGDVLVRGRCVRL